MLLAELLQCEMGSFQHGGVKVGLRGELAKRSDCLAVLGIDQVIDREPPAPWANPAAGRDWVSDCRTPGLPEALLRASMAASRTLTLGSCATASMSAETTSGSMVCMRPGVIDAPEPLGGGLLLQQRERHHFAGVRDLFVEFRDFFTLARHVRPDQEADRPSTPARLPLARRGSAARNSRATRARENRFS